MPPLSSQSYTCATKTKNNLYSECPENLKIENINRGVVSLDLCLVVLHL